MQEIRSSNSPVVTGICDPNNSRAQHHRRVIKYKKEILLTEKDKKIQKIQKI